MFSVGPDEDERSVRGQRPDKAAGRQGRLVHPHPPRCRPKIPHPMPFFLLT